MQDKPISFNDNIEYPDGLRWKLQASLRTLEVRLFHSDLQQLAATRKEESLGAAFC